MKKLNIDPESCVKCPLAHFGVGTDGKWLHRCFADEKHHDLTDADLYDQKPEWCPLLPCDDIDWHPAGYSAWRCSVCGTVHKTRSRYCPNCGGEWVQG